MIPKMSKKGFLFTLSAILFATTLVVYSQAFLGVSYDNEKSIINSSAVGTLANMNDSISFNMAKIVGLDIDVNSAGDLNLMLNERIPKGYSVSAKILAFENMLNDIYFPRVAGEHNLEADTLRDGTAEVFVGDVLTIESDYENTKSIIYPNGTNTIRSLDLNVYADGVSDVVTFTENTGSAKLTISYLDTNSQRPLFTQSTTFDPTDLSSLFIDYVGDNNVEFVFGLTDKGENSFSVDVNGSVHIHYTVNMNYSQGADYLPVRLNAVLMQQLGYADANTMLKILN